MSENFRAKVAVPVGGPGHGCWSTSVYFSPKTKRHLDRFIRFSTAHGRKQQTNRLRDHATVPVAPGCIYSGWACGDAAY